MFTKTFRTLIATSVLFTGLTFSQHSFATEYIYENADFNAQMTADSARKKSDFRAAMRKLWEDHITWTRVYIISAFANLPDQNAAAQRLLKNQDDIGNAVKKYYGKMAGDQLAKLLRDHILIAAEIIKAIKAGNTDETNAQIKKWYDNANEIAEFLNMANPKHWGLNEMKMMMKDHLDLTTAEVLARFQGRWDDDVAAYDKIHTQILKMADMLYSGIIRQFPRRF